MSWHFIQSTSSPELAEEFSQIYCWVTPLLPRAKSKSTPVKSSCKDNWMEFSRSFPFGTTLEPCEQTTQNAPKHSPNGRRYRRNSPSVAGSHSHAKTSVPLEKERELPANVADYGPSLPGSLATYDHDSSSWKTHQFSLLGGLEPFVETWPRWGMMLAGELYPLLMPDSLTVEIESGFLLPTPSGVNGGKNHTMGRIDEWGGSSNPLRGTPIGSLCLPEFEELVMGWPVTWTEPTPLGMDKFQEWRHSHGGF